MRNDVNIWNSMGYYTWKQKEKKKTQVYKSKNYSHKEEFLDGEICIDCVLVMLLN